MIGFLYVLINLIFSIFLKEDMNWKKNLGPWKKNLRTS